MKRHLFFGLLAAAGMLFTTSCSKDDTAAPIDDQAQVSFVIPSPDGAISTRAIGDGTSAKKLYWAVYDENDNLLPAISSNRAAFASSKNETVNIRLVKGQAYTVVFWAQNSETNAYTIKGNNDLKEISVNYTGAANDEKRDAFFGSIEIEKVTTDASYTVYVKRPFAQVNVGVDDTEWQDAINAGVTVEQSSISFTNIPNKFNAFTAEADGSVNVDYTLANIIKGTESLKIDKNLDGTDETTEYNYLTMAYILADKTKATTDAVLGFKGTDGETISLNVNAMPYQRNYRTNIVGRVLTSSNDFQVIIDEKFDTPNYIVDVNEVESFAELTAAIEDLTGSATRSYSLAAELTGDKIITLPTALTGGQINFNFDDIADGATLTITDENDQFTGELIISAPEDKLNQIVLDLPGASVTLVGTYGSVASTTGSNTLIVGKDTEITTLTLKKGNVIINGAVGAIVEDANYTDKVTLNTDSYETYIAHQENVDILNLTLPAGEYAQVLDARGGKTINIAAADGAEVVVAGINHASNGTPSTVSVKNITVDNSLDVEGWFSGTGKNQVPCVGAFGGTLTFDNCKFIISGESREETGIATWYVLENNPANLTFNNCTFEAKGTKPAFSMQIYDYVYLTTNNCTFKTGYPEEINGESKTMAVKYVAETNNTATFNNSKVEGVDYFVELGSSKYSGNNYIVNINKTTLGEGVNPFVIAHAEGQIVSIDGNYYSVATTAAQLTSVVANAIPAYSPLTIMLQNDIEGDAEAVQKENVKVIIEGNNHTYDGVILVNGKSAGISTAGLTIQNVNFSTAALSADAFVRLGKDNATRYTRNVTVKNCTFSSSSKDINGEPNVVAVKSYAGGDQNVNLIGCTVNDGMHSLAQFSNIETGLKVEGCTVMSKNGININSSPSLDMNNCGFDVQGYALRVGSKGSVNTEQKIFNVSNSALKSDCAEEGDAVIEVRDNAKYSKITLTNTTLEGTPQYLGNTEQTTIVVK